MVAVMNVCVPRVTHLTRWGDAGKGRASRPRGHTGDVVEKRPDAGIASFLGKMLTTAIPVTFSAAPGDSFRLPPPRLGEHTHCVLRELGFSASQIDAIIG